MSPLFTNLKALRAKINSKIGKVKSSMNKNKAAVDETELNAQPKCVKGKVQEAVGWLTADREAEARGKVERLSGDAEVDGEQVEQAERDVRQEDGEYDPDVDDMPVAKDVTPADADPRTG